MLSHDPYLVEAWLLLAKVLTSEGRPSDVVAVYREPLDTEATIRIFEIGSPCSSRMSGIDS